MWPLYVISIILIFIFEIITSQFDLTWSLKLNILFNYAEHLKGLAPFVIHATPFYTELEKLLSLISIIILTQAIKQKKEFLKLDNLINLKIIFLSLQMSR